MPYIIAPIYVFLGFLLFLGLNFFLVDGNKIILIGFMVFFLFLLGLMLRSNNKIFTGFLIFLALYSFLYSYIGGIPETEKLELSYVEEGEIIDIQKNLEKCMKKGDCDIVDAYNKDLEQINNILKKPNVFSIAVLKSVIKNLDSHKIILEQENIFYKNDIKINYEELNYKIYNSIYSRLSDLSYTKINLFYSERQFKKYISNYLFEIDKQIKNNEELIVNTQEFNWKMLVNRKFMYEYMFLGIKHDLRQYLEKIKGIQELLK